MPEFRFSYIKSSLNELDEQDKQLAEKAMEALRGSHSDYSHFAVGASVMLDNGVTVLGSNQENVSYPCTTCAERSALNYAQSAYPDTNVVAIAIVAQRHESPVPEDFVSPCGLCRQALVEIERRQNHPIKVLLVGRESVTILQSSLNLLPFAF